MSLNKKIIIVFCIIIHVARFSFLESSPPGFYVDESASAVNALCFSENRTDGWHEKSYPMFLMDDLGGVHGAFYIYPLAAWGKLFGFSIYSLRLFSAVSVFIATLGVFLLGRLLFNAEIGFLAFFLSSISPWAFHNSRLAWDASIIPMYTVLFVYFFLRKKNAYDLIFSAFFAVAAIYTYASARVTILLILFLLFLFDIKSVKENKKIYFLFFSFIILSYLPVAYSMKYGVLSARINYISIFANDYRINKGLDYFSDVFIEFLINISKYFNSAFFIYDGDSINYRHSTKQFGALSWPEIIGVLCLVCFFLSKKKFVLDIDRYQDYRNKLALLFLFILSGISPAALTWDSLPHALRASSAWPFISILAAYGLSLFINKNLITNIFINLLTLIYLVRYLYVFYFIFPNESADFFDVKVKALAQRAQSQADWKLDGAVGSHRRFYMHALKGIGCRDSMKIVNDGK